MKKRILSAIIMLAIVIPIIWYGGNIFKIGVAIIGVLALKEILDLKKNHQEYPLMIIILSLISLLILILAEYEGYSIMYGITYKGLAILLLSLLGLTLIYKDNQFTVTNALFIIGAILLLGVSFNAMILVRMFSLYKFIYLILIFVLNDTFAFIGGKICGKHKLIPHVSPNKTIEGSVIGLLTGTIGACIFYHFLVNPINIKVLLATFTLSLIGQIGDLIFSKLKRENDIKDFSNLIPGHGGILDRLDSTIAIMLGYLIFYTFI